jgi:hypothetical protein
MFEDLGITWFVMMVFGAIIFILIMFVPALLELKKPKDAGPRKIMDEDCESELGKQLVSLGRMEEEVKPDQVIIRKLADIIGVLPNLEG